MELAVEHMQDGIKKIALKGRMDIEGTDAVDLRLVAETAAEKALVVFDLTGVEFLASVGIGTLLRSAKALRLRGGEAVLFSTVPVVNLVLEKTRVYEVIRTFSDLEQARASLLAR